MGKTELSRRGTNPDRLTDKERIFVYEYLVDRNGTRAAREAGYKHPQVQSSQLLKRPRIAKFIGKLEREQVERLQLSSDEIATELYYLATRDVIDLCDENGNIVVDNLRDLPERIRKCIDGIKIKTFYNEDGDVTGTQAEIKLSPKLPAVELAMRFLKMIGPDKHLHLHGDKKEIDWDNLLETEERPGNVIDGEVLKKQVEGE